MIAKPPLRWLTSGSHDSGNDDENASGENPKARVLPFDRKVRERLQQREGAHAQAPQWKGVFAAKGKGIKSKGAAGGPKTAAPTKVRVFQVLQVVGVVFALVVFLRSCGIGF